MLKCISNHPDWLCADCQDCTLCNEEYYMVWDNLWQNAGLDEEMMCIGCLENRIQRQLINKDFTKYPINERTFGKRSDRLNDRLGY